MSTNIQRIVKEDISNKITQRHIILEAISNSVQANAFSIKCELYSYQPVLKDDNGEIDERKIDEIKVIDNGEGFTDENIKSFKDYRTAHKIELGCKGVGRLLFLKLFESVSYVSYLAKDKYKVTFPLNFSLDNIEPLKENLDDSSLEENRTTLELKGITNDYYTKWKFAEKRLSLDLVKIKEDILSSLIPTLYFYKENGKNIKIEFIDVATGKCETISNSDIPDFKNDSFSIPTSDGETYKFTFTYQLEKKTGLFHSFYCANKRTVSSFSEQDFKISIPEGYSGYFLLESKYLDENVANDRNEFTIMPKKTDAYLPISWEIINNSLKPLISNIIKNEIPEAIKINKGQLSSIQDERPYLIEYIDDDDIDIAGFIDKKQIIDKAKRKFDLAKESLISNIGHDSYSDTELQEAIALTQNELVSYIQDRVIIIDRLKTMHTKKEKVEKFIHNLFMPKNTDDNYYCIGKNNLWLLDDRFISYSYAASDKTIKSILKNINLEAGTDIDGDKPDISLFFQREPNTACSDIKSVVVEIKPFDYSSKPARKKFAGLVQLREYVKAFKSKNNIKEVWAFLVTDIDDDFSTLLLEDGYQALFSTDRPMYYRFYEKINAFIYVICASTIIADAEARNKSFIDIINKQNKLQKYLSNKT